MSSTTNKSATSCRKSDEEYKKSLTPDQYHVTREKGTEQAYTGEYDKFFQEGEYECVCCGSKLFTSDAKYNSGCGWPAFYEAHGRVGKDENSTNVMRLPDDSQGMPRTEVICKQCDAHLGHVFSDGPAPTGERFCINSASLKFKKK